ncbi:MAG: hypothetical protein J6332_02460 [Abditibacteriota bacterium]|nr:hypothetical protein [Abditibacteriota bacterium]
MKKLFVVLLVSAVAVSCAFAAEVLHPEGTPEWTVDYSEGGAQIASDDAGGVYVYGEGDAFAQLNYFVDSDSDGWLINANAGDTLTVDFTVTGVIDDPENRPGVGIDFTRSEPYSTTILFTGMTFPGVTDNWTSTSEIIDGKTVTSVTSSFTLTEDAVVITGLKIPTEYYTGSETDGSVKYEGIPGYHVSAPVITLTRASEPEEETEVPEPCTIAYALTGLGSLAGIKRRIKK